MNWTTIEAQAPLFSHNRFNLLSLSDRDYLHGTGTSIQSELERLLGPLRDGEHHFWSARHVISAMPSTRINFHLRMAGAELPDR